MRSYKFSLLLAARELKAQKIIAAFILIAVILSSIMTTVIGASLGILQTMRVQQAASLNGNRYATFHQLNYEQLQLLNNDSRLFDVNSLINVGNTKLANSGLTLYMREYLDNALETYPTISKLKEGRLPLSSLEIALPEDALQYFDDDIHVGSKINLLAQISFMDGRIPAYEYSAEFTVCGILQSNYIGYSTGILDAVLGEGSASKLLPDEYLLYSTDFKVKDTMKFQEIINDLAQKCNIEKSYIQYNWILLDALGISYDEVGASDTDTGFSFMTLACILVGILVLLAAGLVIYNVLKIAITKRIREYGILRAIGCDRGQIYCLVSLELLILCGIGIPIGLFIGAFSAKAILIAAMGMLNPDLFMAGSITELNEMISATSSNNIIYYFISALVTILFSMLAAFPAAHYAAHVSPTIAMSGQSTKIRRRHRKIKAIYNFEAYYARMNLNRGRSRTAITILSLIMSITVFVALQGFVLILDASSKVKNMHLGDYSITNENTGIDPESIVEIIESKFVENLSTTKLSTYSHDKNNNLPIDINLSLQSWEAFHIAAIDNKRLTSYTDQLSKTDIEDLISGTACIVQNPIPITYEGKQIDTTNLSYDDIISVNGHKLRVAGISNNPITINNEGFTNGVQIIVNNDIYDILTGVNRYCEIYPTLYENTDNEKFEEWLNNWCKKNSGSHWLSYAQLDAQLSESFEQINFLCIGLIIFIGLIGIINIINTVYSNIHTRISEIGMQRAIGMSIGSLYKTFLWEGAYYGIIASIIGGLLGYIFIIFINAATTDALQLVPVPIFSIFQAAVISIAVCLLATAIPLHLIAKMNIVSSIEAVE